MPGFFPQHTVHHERAFYFLVLVLFQLGANEHFQLAEDCPAVVMPEDHTRRLFLHMIQVELLANLAVVTLGRFFQTQQMRVKRFFICPCGTVNTLQHLVVAVAAPVRACGFHQFKVMTKTHIRHVRSTAHVDVLFMMIQARLVIMGDIFIKNGNFISLATLHKGFTRFVPADFLLDDVIILLGELMHTFFERVDIFLGQRMIEVDVIIEAVIDNRADSHLGVWPQLLNRMTEQMRAGVTNDFQAVFIFCSNDGEGCIVFDEVAGIDQLTIHSSRDRGFRQAWTDIQSNIQRANGVVKMALAAIRKRNYRHFMSLFAVVPHTKEHIQNNIIIIINKL